MTTRTHVRLTPLHSVTRPADGSAVLTALTGVYERGWQPADVLHVTRRSLGAGEVKLAIWAILYDARITRAAERAPQRWLEHLHAIAELGAQPSPSGATALQRTAVTALWRRLPRLASECPPPSQWPAHRVTPNIDAHAAPAAAVDAKVLSRIRGLLAKAEGTEFAEEAETFTAKAQELMTKYAVTAALVESRDCTTSTVVQSRRIHLDNPYIKEKALLLSEIAGANRVRSVWFSTLGMASLVGTPIDLEQTEMLFTSLLVQATRAMQDEARRGGGPDAASSKSYRRAFLYGFAIRIGQRLRMTQTSATAQAALESAVSVEDLLPVLAQQSAAVDRAFEQLFPTTTATRTSPVDAAGWYAGQAAAERASLRNGTRSKASPHPAAICG
ncbi:DUF2786 domain-containing protein [Antrihabitans stalactiti]|uniref:DUF2786 domain-containing protein n=1 Tax=Antrihabitans stalactiti TaxID=2584121 RepID=A0A848KFS9_9NOCA|nr:DUF2786 domain-containing protein [Antrihabitans stalactiti]NMN96606.1 DUF2786 domain-containing protein [Antrihabitans stalactiti]